MSHMIRVLIPSSVKSDQPRMTKRENWDMRYRSEWGYMISKIDYSCLMSVCHLSFFTFHMRNIQVMVTRQSVNDGVTWDWWTHRCLSDNLIV